MSNAPHRWQRLAALSRGEHTCADRAEGVGRDRLQSCPPVRVTWDARDAVERGDMARGPFPGTREEGGRCAGTQRAGGQQGLCVRHVCRGGAMGWELGNARVEQATERSSDALLPAVGGNGRDGPPGHV